MRVWVVVVLLVVASAVRARVSVTNERGVMIHGVSERAAESFKGLRYAEPPTGVLRFQPAKLMDLEQQAVNNKINAAQFGPECMQKVLSDPQGPVMSEDCLFLNVWRPVGTTNTSKLNVMVWIHGGAMQAGSGSDRLFDGSSLVSSQNVVLVTINYRLNPLGFLPLHEFDSATGSGGANGQLDQITSLTWVRNNIATFGGDPSAVTIFGESAGSQSTCSLLISPVSRRLFKRAILQSGSCNGPWSPAPKENGNDVYKCMQQHFNISASTTKEDTLRQLQSLPAEALSAWPVECSLSGTFWEDGHVIPMQPREAYLAASRGGAGVNAVDVMLGATTHDGITTFVGIAAGVTDRDSYENATLLWYTGAYNMTSDTAESVFKHYAYSKSNGFGSAADAFVMGDGDFTNTCPALKLAGLLSTSPAPRHLAEAKVSVNVFSYTFAHLGGGDIAVQQNLTTQSPPFAQWASHASELPFVFHVSTFGNWDHVSPDIVAPFTPAEDLLSRQIMDLWGSFARTGQPEYKLEGGGTQQERAQAAKWPAYPKHLFLTVPGPKVLDVKTFKKEDCAFWEPLEPWAASISG